MHTVNPTKNKIADGWLGDAQASQFHGLLASEVHGGSSRNSALRLAKFKEEHLHERAICVLIFRDGENDRNAAGFGHDHARGGGERRRLHAFIGKEVHDLRLQAREITRQERLEVPVERSAENVLLQRSHLAEVGITALGDVLLRDAQRDIHSVCLHVTQNVPQRLCDVALHVAATYKGANSKPLFNFLPAVYMNQQIGIVVISFFRKLNAKSYSSQSERRTNLRSDLTSPHLNNSPYERNNTGF